MQPVPRRDWSGYLYAVGAACCYGAAAPLIRIGLTRYGSVITGITIAVLTGIIALAPLAYQGWRRQEYGRSPDRRTLGFVLLSGCTAICGFGSNTFALSQLPVVKVAPISSTYPLVTVLLAWLVMRESERITRRTLSGVILIVAGVIIVTIARSG